MTGPWWIAGRDARAILTDGPGPYGSQPELAKPDPATVRAALLARIAGFTPEWSDRTTNDAGMALLQLFSELQEPVTRSLDRLPEKYLIEYLRIGGVSARGGAVPEVTVQFAVADNAPRSVLIPEGFQIGGNDAETDAVVIYETRRSIFAAPGKIAATLTQGGNSFVAIANDGKAAFLPFGRKPKQGRAIWFGIDAVNAPGPLLTLGIEVAPGALVPDPVEAGGLLPAVPAPSVLLGWDVLNGSTTQEAELVRDDTAGLSRSGTVELKLPAEWRKGSPPGSNAAQLFWVRFRLAFGKFPSDPKFLAVRLNAVDATAARTIRDEVMEAVPSTVGVNARMRVLQAPVLEGTLVLEVEEGGMAAAGALSTATAPVRTNAQVGNASTAVRWSEVEDLALYGPEDRVYVFDATTGVATFGDGRYGRALPQGFRHVHAVRYQTPSEARTPPLENSVKSMISSAPFVQSVTNSRKGSGGVLAETSEQTLRRGTEEIRARRRAVTVADYDLLATTLAGALVARAHAVGGFHPKTRGTPLPGVVTVFVVPPDRDQGKPIADEATLRAVAEGLSETAALMGVDIVAAPATFLDIAVEASVVIDPDADVAGTVRALLDDLDTYLHPLRGGDNGTGWPFGGPIVYDDLLRRMLSVPNILAAPRVNLRVNGVRQPSCTGFAVPPNTLLWPGGHVVIPVEDAS